MRWVNRVLFKVQYLSPECDELCVMIDEKSTKLRIEEAEA
jgi:hypothetical protein